MYVYLKGVFTRKMLTQNDTFRRIIKTIERKREEGCRYQNSEKFHFETQNDNFRRIKNPDSGLAHHTHKAQLAS